MLKKIYLGLLILLIPFSSFLTLFGNFTLLDVYILITVLFFIFFYKEPYISKRLIFEILLIDLLFVLILTFNILLGDLNQDILGNALQFLFLFNIVALFSNIFVNHYTFSEFSSSIMYLSIFMVLITIIGSSLNIPIIVESGSGRLLPVFLGTSSVFTFAMSVSAYEYIYKEKGFFNLCFYIFLTFIMVLYTGQRSLFAACLLVIITVAFIKKPILVAIASIASLFFASFIIVLLANYPEYRFIGNLFTDSSRIIIVQNFLLDLSKDPWMVFTGMGIEVWSDPKWQQEPHLQFLHLISDYGILIAIMYLLIGYRFIFKVFDNNKRIKILSRIFLVTALPLMLFHTYSLERGQILIFFIFSTYLLNNSIFFYKEKGLNNV